MTGLEKIAAALSPAGTAATPAVICYEGIFYRDHWAEFPEAPWWALAGGDADQHYAVYAARLARVGQDWYVLPHGPSHHDQAVVRVEPRADGVYRVDTAKGTATRLAEPVVGGGFLDPERGRPCPVTPDAVDRLWPVPTGDGYDALVRDGRADLAARLRAGAGRELCPIAHVGSPLWACWGLWPFEELMTLTRRDPELLRHACERFVDCHLPRLPGLARFGARLVWIEECWLDMVSPATYARVHLPALQRLVAGIRAAGMWSVFYYCGNPHDRLDLLLAAGADALSLEEGKKGFQIDIAEIARRVAGRCALLGNLDAIGLLEHGSDDALRAELARQLRAGQELNRGRFIMSLGSPVTPGTAVGRVRRYCDLVHELAAG